MQDKGGIAADQREDASVSLPREPDDGVTFSCTGVSILTGGQRTRRQKPLCLGIERRLREMISNPADGNGSELSKDDLGHVSAGYSLYTKRMVRHGSAPILERGYSIRFVASEEEESAKDDGRERERQLKVKKQQGKLEGRKDADAGMRTGNGVGLAMEGDAQRVEATRRVPSSTSLSTMNATDAILPKGDWFSAQKLMQRAVDSLLSSSALKELDFSHVDEGVPPYWIGDAGDTDLPMPGMFPREDAMPGSDDRADAGQSPGKPAGNEGDGDDENEASKIMRMWMGSFGGVDTGAMTVASALARATRDRLLHTGTSWAKSMEKQAQFMGTFARRWVAYIFNGRRKE